jgi:basic membrane protein A
MGLGRSFRVSMVLLVVATLVAACGESGESGKSETSEGGGKKQLKVAFIMNGPRTDQGFNTAIFNGIEEVTKKYGSRVDVTYKESVPENTQAMQVIQSLVNEGNEVIFATSYGYHEHMTAASKKYPKVKFHQWQSSELGPNLNQYYFAIGESWYLAGMAAAAASENGTIGMVASFPIPSVLAQVNAVELGAKAVNPKATTRIIWLGSWYDPAKATQAAESLATSGVGALVNALNDTSVVQIAGKQQLPVVGQAINQEKFAKDSWLTGAQFNFGPYFVRQMDLLLGGGWKGNESYVGGMDDGVTSISPFGARYEEISASVRAKIQEQQKQLTEGTFNPWRGPIRDQKGKVVVPAGKTLSRAESQVTPYLIEGVLGTDGS